MRYVCFWYGMNPADGMPVMPVDPVPLGPEVHVMGYLEPSRHAAMVRVHAGRISVLEWTEHESAGTLDGFAVIDARDLNDAIRIASRLPPARHGNVEVRAIRSTAGSGSAGAKLDPSGHPDPNH